MIIVREIWDSALTIFGQCGEEKMLRRITDAVELLANKGEVDALVGFVDLCVDGNCVTLPREVETVLGVNIGGRPSLGRDVLFSFHLNGPGDFNKTCGYTWEDAGTFPTYRDIRCPAKLVAFLDSPEDTGKSLIVYGFDEQNRPLRRRVNGEMVDGYQVPTIYGYALPDAGAPLISRIEWIDKARMVGNVRLSSFDNSSSSGTLLGVFEPDETKPEYRRLKLHRNCGWIRLCYRRKSLELLSRNDRILLHSRPALILAMQALKKYEEFQLSEAVGFEAQATRLLTEKESVMTSPTANPIQVNDRNSGRNDDAWVD